jgi:hypothetical protein
MNPGAPEEYAVPAPHVAPIILEKEREKDQIVIKTEKFSNFYLLI